MKGNPRQTPTRITACSAKLLTGRWIPLRASNGPDHAPAATSTLGAATAPPAVSTPAAPPSAVLTRSAGHPSQISAPARRAISPSTAVRFRERTNPSPAV